MGVKEEDENVKSNLKNESVKAKPKEKEKEKRLVDGGSAVSLVDILSCKP